MTNFAIDYVIGYQTRTIVLLADDADDAFDRARSALRARGLVSVSLQGTARVATDFDIVRHETGRSKS